MYKEFSTCPILENNSSLTIAPCSMEMISENHRDKILLCKTCGKHDNVDLDEISRSPSIFGNLLSFIVITSIVLLIGNHGQLDQKPQPSNSPQSSQSS